MICEACGAENLAGQSNCEFCGMELSELSEFDEFCEVGGFHELMDEEYKFDD